MRDSPFPQRVRRDAAAVRVLTGKGALRQLCEPVTAAVRYRAVRKHYYVLELDLDENRVRAGNHLMRSETKKITHPRLRSKRRVACMQASR